MNFLTAPFLYGLLALAAALGLAAGVQTVRLSSERAAHAGTKLGHAQTLQEIAELTAVAAAAARAREAQHTKDLTAARLTQLEDLTSAQTRIDALAADLAAERRKLRDYWTQNRPAAAVPGADPADSRGESDAELRAAGLGRVLGTVAACQAQVKFLLARNEAAEKLCDGGVE